MISSFFSFIFRTIILEPMALLGVILGVCGWYYLGPDSLLLYAKNPTIYGVLFAIALLYALLFKHVYYPNTKNINWWETFKSSFNHFLTIILAIVFTAAIFFALNYGFGEKLDKYLRHQN